jgi:hypothetical protein
VAARAVEPRVPRRAVVLASLAALVWGASACGGDDDAGAGRAQPVALARSGGCGDAFFWASSADETVAVTVTVEARERSAAAPTTVTFSVPDPEVTVEIQRGRGLTQPFCNDVIDGNVWRVDETAAAEAGTGEIVLDPLVTGPMSCGGHGTLHLEGLTASDGTRFGTLDVATDAIGCYAG